MTLKLDGIAAGAQVNSVTGVKGNAESAYRQGNINLTPANIGAAVSTQLTNQNLNNVTTPGFYNAGGANTCANKPSGVTSFGMLVVQCAAGAYHRQELYPASSTRTWVRINNNGTWSAWYLIIHGNANGWVSSKEPSQNNLHILLV